MPDPIASELRAKDEHLLNAVHRGDRKIWAELTTADFLYIEDGLVTDRSELLKGLEEDGSAPLVIRSYVVHQVGDTAMGRTLQGPFTSLCAWALKHQSEVQAAQKKFGGA